MYCIRLRSVTKLLSWLLLYILPTAFYAAIGYNGTPASYVLLYMLVLLATFTLYELGYIFNDTFAIRRESKPSKRLNKNELNYFFSHKWHIIATRVGIAFLCLFMLSFYISILPISIALITMCGLFGIYNRWRNKYNVFLYVWLVFSRYLPFMLLCEHSWRDYLLLFLSYPLLIGIERFSMPTYRWPLMRKLIPDETSKARFRMWYYAIALILISAALYYAGQPLVLLIPFGILFLYRFIRYQFFG